MSETLLTQVVTILTTSGAYRTQPRLVAVDDVDFEFDAILRGPAECQGLVLVLNCDPGRLPMAISRLRAFNQMMLRTGSLRPLSLVAVTRLEEGELLRELEALCRVIRVSEGDESTVRIQLRGLLPLSLPEPESPHGDVTRMLRESLAGIRPEDVVASLMAAGRRGEVAVEEAVISAINAAIAEAMAEESHS